jgi:hypothetical protein
MICTLGTNPAVMGSNDGFDSYLQAQLSPAQRLACWHADSVLQAGQLPLEWSVHVPLMAACGMASMRSSRQALCLSNCAVRWENCRNRTASLTGMMMMSLMLQDVKNVIGTVNAYASKKSRYSTPFLPLFYVMQVLPR